MIEITITKDDPRLEEIQDAVRSRKFYNLKYGDIDLGSFAITKLYVDHPSNLDPFCNFRIHFQEVKLAVQGTVVLNEGDSE